MNHLAVGVSVKNSVQNAKVRWFGNIEGVPIIGLETIDLMLPGYTDGTCPYNKERYFKCKDGHGYYVLEKNFNHSYTVIHEEIDTIKDLTASDSEYNSLAESRLTPPITPRSPQCQSSSVSPATVSQVQFNTNSNQKSPLSCGVLSRLTFGREQRNSQTNLSSTSCTNIRTSTSSTESDLQLSPVYHPENYQSASDDQTKEIPADTHSLNYDSNNDNNDITIFSTSQLTNNEIISSSQTSLPLFGQEYFLNNWTLRRVKALIDNEINVLNQLNLHIFENQCNVQDLINEQIDGVSQRIPNPIPNDICIELTKLFDTVEIIFLSRAISLYNNDYLLLAILCSNNQCAYVRTSNGWAYTDDENEYGHPIVVDEVSEMIDDHSSSIYNHSEQCLHILKNASFLYYKLVE